MEKFLPVKNIYITVYRKKKKSVRLVDYDKGGGLVSSVHLLEFLIVVVICGLLVIRSLAEVGW